MDPQSAAFTPRDEIWRFQSDMLRVQQTQSDHGERLSRLERRQDEDARMKSVWGTSSPFPGVLSGTPQQGRLSHFLEDIQLLEKGRHTSLALQTDVSNKLHLLILLQVPSNNLSMTPSVVSTTIQAT